MKPLVLRVASPCTERWDSMQGDERTRHCLKCRMNVYNISSMSRAEVDALLLKAEGRVCGRFFQRRDGTVLTRDCPVGLRKVRARLAAALTTAVALMLAAVGWRVVVGGARASGQLPLPEFKERVVAIKEQLRSTQSLGPIIEWLDPAPPVLMLGDISPPSSSP